MSRLFHHARTSRNRDRTDLPTDGRTAQRWRLLMLLWVAVIAAVLQGCRPKAADDAAPTADVVTDAAITSDCSYSIGNADVGCSAPPDTFATTGLSGTGNGSAWDAWAWNAFAAFNWPAQASSDTAAYPTGYVRGVPSSDPTKTFAAAISSDVAVWETFKEKRELFNADATADAWQDLTFDSQYAPTFDGGMVQPCAGIEEAMLARVKAAPRVIAQLSKQAPSIDGDSSADETAEVASPAQESQDQLCAGYTGSALESCQMNFQPPPAEGSTTCQDGSSGCFKADQDNFRPAVGPRVFKGGPGSENFVYYEVKLNYDYYRYVAENGLDDYDTAATQAKAGAINLPFRTTASSAPGPNADAFVGYSAASTRACYQSGLANCSIQNRWGAISAQNIPQIGSIQLKAAWLPAMLLDGDVDDYHTTEAVYYKDSASQPQGLCYDVQQFGLIGLHIIQRVHGGSSSAEPIGGTFIFATWEHESIADGAGYTYVNYFADQADEQVDPDPYPNTAAGLQVSRLQTYPMSTTTAVTNQVHQALPSDSVWQNYRLIGTQFQAISTDSASADLGQPYYLANLVIETNRGLQQFQGQPPALQVIKKYQPEIPLPTGVTPHFAATANNLAFNQSGYLMGGCMGCHGVAQSQGYSFSFVLQDGKFGTKPDTAGTIAIPPKAPPAD